MDKQQLLRRLGWERSQPRITISEAAHPTQGPSSSLGRVDLPSAISGTVELESLSDILNRASRQLHESERVHADCLHVSSLIGDYLCPRRIWLARHHHLTAISRVSPAMKIVWDMGRACEKTVRDLLIAGMGRSRVLGKWSCACGKTSHVGQGQEIHCSICDTDCAIYGEADLYYSPLKIFGHSDFIYLDENRNVNVVEIKSINKSDWLALSEPKHDHVVQVSMYYFMLRESVGQERMYPGAQIIYVCKDYITRQMPWKCYTVPQRTCEAASEEVLRTATAVQSGYAPACPPRLMCCTSPDCLTSRNCIACAVCFMHND
jgi:hypothetical protein